MIFNNALIKAGLVCLYVTCIFGLNAQSFETTKEEIRILNNEARPIAESRTISSVEEKYIKDNESGEIVSKYLGEIDGVPLYIYPLSEDLGITNNTKALNEGESLGYDLEGEGMTLILNDVGSPRVNHVLFSSETGESRIAANNEPVTFHPTHMASIICGNSTLGATYKGMASKAKIELMENYGQQQYAESLVSNHSVIRAPGMYHYFFDGNTFNHPYHTEVTASGNDGPLAYTLRNNSKNEITIGNVEDYFSYDSPKDIVIVPTSSAGPTIDGRIKPDIVANGKSVLAASHVGNSSIANGAGTSQACAGASGSLLLVQEYYHNQYDTYMRSATLKALSVHTARECGSSPGPDYYFGYGALNTLEMVKVIENDTLGNSIHQNDLAENQDFTMEVYPNYEEPLIVTLAWTDPSGNKLIVPYDGSAIDTSLRALVNDLDIRITNEGKTYKPYTLDRMNPCEPAVNGNNVFDNLEMIEIPRPTNSDEPYTIEVSHKGSLVNGHQYFSLIVTGISDGQVDEINQSIKVDFNTEKQWGADKNLHGDIIVAGDLNINAGLTGMNNNNRISVLENGELSLTNSIITNVDIYLLPNSKLILDGVTFLDNSNVYLLDSVTVEQLNFAGLYTLSDSTYVYDFMSNINLPGLVVPEVNLIESEFPGIMAERICIFNDQLVDTVYNICAQEVFFGMPSDEYGEGVDIDADIEINSTCALVTYQDLKVMKNKSFSYKISESMFTNPIIVPETELAPIVHKYYNGIKYMSNPCQYNPINIYN